MRRRQPGEVVIGIGARSVALVQVHGRWRRETRLLAQEALPVDQPASVAGLDLLLGRLLAQARCEGMPARVVVGEPWVRHWMVTPPVNATRMSDLKLTAAARFDALFADGRNGWRMEADWRTADTFLAAALWQPLMDMVAQQAQQHRMVLLNVVSHLTACWNRWRDELRPAAWFGVIHGDQLCCLVVQGPKLLAVRSLQLPEATNQTVLRHLLTNEALRLAIAAPTELQLCGNVRPHWSGAGSSGLVCQWLDDPRRSAVATPADAASDADGDALPLAMAVAA